MSETKPALQGRVLEIEWMKAVAVIGMVLVHVSMSSSGAVIGFLSPALVSITDIYANITIALCVRVVSYFGGILLKRTNLIHV